MERCNCHNEIELLKWKRFRQNVTFKKRKVGSAAGGPGLIQAAVIGIDADDLVG